MGSKIKLWFTSRLVQARLANPYMWTLYIFNALSLVGGTVYGLYYGIFLYRHTFSLSVLAVDGLLGGVGTWIGYVAGIHCIRRYGYGTCIRLAFILWTGVAFGTALIAPHIAAWFMLIAIIKALPAGLYAAVGDTIMLREVQTQARSGFFQLNLALEFIASIILPSLVGALIRVTAGYQWAFVAAGIIYAGSFLYYFKLPKPTVAFSWRELLHTFRRPLYAHHAMNRTLAAGFNQLNAFALTIVPFLLLKNELSIGLVTSLSATVAAIVALRARRMQRAHNIRLGYGAYGVRAVAALSFVLTWAPPLMMIWQIIGKLMTPLHDPLQQSLDIHNDSLILGDEVRRKALQINLLNNTLVLLGTTIAFGGFLAITQTDTQQQKLILQVLVMIYAGWRFINLFISAWINKWAQNLQEYVSLRSRLRGFVFGGGA